MSEFSLENRSSIKRRGAAENSYKGRVLQFNEIRTGIEIMSTIQNRTIITKHESLILIVTKLEPILW